MSAQVQDVVRFRGDLLFDGAVNVDWLLDDPERARVAAQSFVFHGPQYHGVSQEEVGVAHGHQLEDSASFARAVVRRCCGLQEEPFALAIAGYGTGKSHLALALAVLLSEPTSEAAARVLQALEIADAAIGADIRALLAEQQRPVLCVALNGMRSFDLTSEVTRQIIHQVRAKGLSTRCLEDLRPRFAQAANMVRTSSEAVVEELVRECDAADAAAILSALDRQDETVYVTVQEFYAARGLAIRALGGESVRDVIGAATSEYCGEGKPFARLLFLFDEFGRYTEFATMRSQIAGSGVLQDLFEGVQNHSDVACFVGLIQFELNAYVQRVAPEFRNEILRYVTRYQTAKKSYLSINLETLLASLLEKRAAQQLDAWFDSDAALQASTTQMRTLQSWFPQSLNHRLWTIPDQFHSVIRKGCWPLAPHATWFLFSLAASGRHLQQRSALALLADAAQRIETCAVPDDGTPPLLAVDLWSDALLQEFIASEEGGQQGAIAHVYASVNARHGARLPPEAHRLLRAVVMSSKVGIRSEDEDDAVTALAALSGLELAVARDQVRTLREDYNVIEWDERFRSFDILGDAVPRSQFLAFVRQRVASSYDGRGKAQLFASRARVWCEELLGDLDCDFAERQRISTREWRYEGLTSNVELIGGHLKYATDRWQSALAVEDPRGTIIYCYVEPERDPDAVTAEVRKQLRSLARETGYGPPPILVVLLCDEEGHVGRALAELAVLEDSLSEEDAARFGSLVGAHREKMRATVRTYVESMIKERRYVTGVRDELEGGRLGPVGTELFGLIYKRPLPFPLDGFATIRGNAADTCQQLTAELLRGSLDYDSVLAKSVKVKNRALTVLDECWRAFTKTGAVSRRPAHPTVSSAIQQWDQAVRSDQERFLVGPALRQISLPPFGANAASAGLLFALFVAPRVDELVFIRDGQQYAVAQLVQDGLFRGKLLDIAALDDVELVSVGEASSEWETLLDEWEQQESHIGRIDNLRQAQELRDRVPVPPSLHHRYLHLQSQAESAAAAVRRMDDQLNEALERIERGHERADVGHLSWGAAQMVDLHTQMDAELLSWTDDQRAALSDRIHLARQQIVQQFEAWLSRQRLTSEQPAAVGELKHKLLNLIGGHLKKLQLAALCEPLEARVSELVRTAEAQIDARELLRSVRAWLDTHADVCRIPRLAELRGLRDVGKEFSDKLRTTGKRIEMAEIGAIRTELTGFLEKLQHAEADLTAKAGAVWDSRITSEADLEAHLSEVNRLKGALEGCDRDLEDLLLLERALQTYRSAPARLGDENLTWREFDALSARLQDEAQASLDEDEPPWPPRETITVLASEIAERRRQSSAAWLSAMQTEAAAVASMSAGDANRLRVQLMRAPATLTHEDRQCADALLEMADSRLEALEVEGLLERFRGLPTASQRRFVELAAEILGAS